MLQQLAGPFVLVLALVACDSEKPAVPYPTVSLTVAAADQSASATVTAEVVNTPAQRQQGLMFRQVLNENAAMLFLFPRDVTTGFWMRNTYVPLTIAYIAADGTVLELRDGVPLDETVLTPAQPYRYVLEVNQGWFERHGLGVGAKVALPPDLPPAQ